MNSLLVWCGTISRQPTSGKLELSVFFCFLWRTSKRHTHHERQLGQLGIHFSNTVISFRSAKEEPFTPIVSTMLWFSQLRALVVKNLVLKEGLEEAEQMAILEIQKDFDDSLKHIFDLSETKRFEDDLSLAIDASL